jgi:hypothetical protein
MKEGGHRPAGCERNDKKQTHFGDLHQGLLGTETDIFVVTSQEGRRRAWQARQHEKRQRRCMAAASGGGDDANVKEILSTASSG